MPVSHTVASHFLARLRSPAQGAVVDVAWFDAGDVEPGEQLVPASRRVIIPGGGNIDVRRQVTQRVMAVPGLVPGTAIHRGTVPRRMAGTTPAMMGWMAPSRHLCAKVGFVKEPTNGSHP